MRIKRESFMAMTEMKIEPLVLNIASASKDNKYYRKVVWTGNSLQVALMSIDAGEEIGAEVHPDNDQFIKIEGGRGKILIGNGEDDFYYQRIIDEGYAIMIPAGTWHNIINISDVPLKLYTVYAPPHHANGRVDITKEDEVH